MKAKRLALFLLIAPALTLYAEEYPEFVSMMKMANQAANALSKMEKKTGPQAVRAAERLGSIYEELIGFWHQRNSAAVKIAEEGKAAAAELATAAFAGDAEKAEAAFKTLGGTCKSCHDARREKLADGKYRIK